MSQPAGFGASPDDAVDFTDRVDRDTTLSDLHHLLGRGFVTLLGHVLAAQSATPAEYTEAHSQLADAHVLLAKIQQHSRNLLEGMAPAPLGGRTLERALHDTLDEVEKIHGLTCSLVTTGSPTLTKSFATDALAVAQEAIMNVVEHAEATTVRVGLIPSGNTLALMIEDDGKGFDQHASDDSRKLGIRQMKERVFARGGSMSITSEIGWGTVVRAQLPLPTGTVSGAPIRVAVIEQRPALRSGIATLLTRADPSIVVVGELGSVADARDAVATLAPSVVMLGLGFIDEAPALIEHLCQAYPQMPVVIVSTPFTSSDLLDRAMAAGAELCVDASADGATLANAVIAAVRGQAVTKANQAIRPDLKRAELTSLTAREREIRQLIERGMADREIAKLLVISVKTVEKHVSSVLRKAGARNRMQLLLEHRIDGQGNIHERRKAATGN